MNRESRYLQHGLVALTVVLILVIFAPPLLNAQSPYQNLCAQAAVSALSELPEGSAARIAAHIKAICESAVPDTALSLRDQAAAMVMLQWYWLQSRFITLSVIDHIPNAVFAAPFFPNGSGRVFSFADSGPLVHTFNVGFGQVMTAAQAKTTGPVCVSVHSENGKATVSFTCPSKENKP